MRAPQPVPAATLAVRALGCERGGRILFAGIDLDLAPGALVTLTGPNGAGKSTLLRMIAGLVPSDQGSIVWGGDGEAPAASTLVHYHGHREGLRDALSARENLSFATALLGGDPARVPGALDQVGASRLADLPVRVLSAGQRRRVALARLLTVPRPVWLLDEPLAALDIAGQALVSDLIGAHVAAGGSALVATHQPLGVTGRALTLRGFA